MNKLTEEKEKDNKGQWVWVLLIRIIGLGMFAVPLYLPFMAYLNTSIETIKLSGYDIMFVLCGFVIALSGKQIGVIANNIGAILTAFLKKMTA